MPEQVPLNIGDIVEQEGPTGPSKKVVMQLFPSVSVAHIIEDEG